MYKMRLAFFSPQGTMRLRDDAYLKKQGSTAENGGQVIYVIEMARALAHKGHQVDIFARRYQDDGDDLLIETDPETPNVRVFHIPTRALDSVEKEHFYPYYPEYLGGAIKLVSDTGYEYDAIVGHYADGMMLAAGLERHFSAHGRHVPLMGVTHSLGVEKAHSLHTSLSNRIQAETGISLSKDQAGFATVDRDTYLQQRADSFDKTDRNHQGVVTKQDVVAAATLARTRLRDEFNAAVRDFNIKPRLGCELSALAHVDGVACVSSAHLNSLFDDYSYPEDQMAVIPGGINHAVFRQIKGVSRDDLIAPLEDRDDLSDATRAAIRDGHVVFGYGRFVRAKGILNAVKAMEHILTAHPDAVYVYAGGNMPPKSEEEKALYLECMDHARAKGYADRIAFLGRQDQTVIAQWLNASNAYLHCALLEPFGLAPQEAAATGIATVISKNAGVSEVLENNIHTLHTDPQSPRDIAKQVGRVLSNPALGHRLAMMAVDYINNQATWAARAQQTVDFLQEEIGPVYFAKREQRINNGNRYATFALQEINRRGFADLPEELRPYAERARDILVSMLPTGLPDSNTPSINLEFHRS